MLQLQENQGKIQSGNMVASFPILQLLFRMEKHPSYFLLYQTPTEKIADGVRRRAQNTWCFDEVWSRLKALKDEGRESGLQNEGRSRRRLERHKTY